VSCGWSANVWNSWPTQEDLQGSLTPEHKGHNGLCECNKPYIMADLTIMNGHWKRRIHFNNIPPSPKCPSVYLFVKRRIVGETRKKMGALRGTKSEENGKFCCYMQGFESETIHFPINWSTRTNTGITV
jgi:hypothetical protein